MIKKINNKIIKDKFNLVIVIVFIFTVAFTAVAYILRGNANINRVSFFIDGIFAQLLLYRIIRFVSNRCSVKFVLKDFIIIAGTIIVSFGIYFLLINIRTTIYSWDNTTYYKLMNSLLPCFDNSVLAGISEWFFSGMSMDYGSFLLAFVYPFYTLVGSGIHAFIYSYFIGCVIPVIVVLYIFSAFVINQVSNDKNNLLYKILVGVVLISFPLLHAASILGQPDVFGLAFAGIIVLLTINYDFSKIDITRWIVLFCLTVSLTLTRRWYMFFVVAYYISYFVILFISKLVSKDFNTFKKTIINTVIFGASSLIIGVLALYRLITTVIGNNYSESYNSWSRGGLGYEMINQFEYLGLFVSLIVVIGWVYGIVNKKLRIPTLTMLFTYILGIVLFTRIQNMGHHQSLILMLPYIYGVFSTISMLINSKVKYSSIIPALILVASMVNCTCLNLADNVGDILFSKLNIYPEQRTDLAQMDKVVNYLQNKVKNDESVTILAGSDMYDGSIFSNYPDIDSNKFISVNNYYAASEGFPENFLTDKYVLLLSPIQEREQVKKEKVLSTIVKEFSTNSKINKKFKEIYSVNLSSKVTATVYQRIKPVDNAEISIFIKDFNEYCKMYPDLFYNRLMSYKK